MVAGTGPYCGVRAVGLVQELTVGRRRTWIKVSQPSWLSSWPPPPPLAAMRGALGPSPRSRARAWLGRLRQ